MIAGRYRNAPAGTLSLMPDAVTTILDALALAAVAAGIGVVVGASIYGLMAMWHPEWLAAGGGVAVGGGVLLGVDRWVTGHSGGRT